MTNADIQYDAENSVVRVVPTGKLTATSAHKIVKKIDALLDGKSRRQLLVDLGNMTPQNFPSDALHSLSQDFRTLKLDKQAVVLTNPLIRSFAKLVIRLAGLPHPIKFFKNCADAEKWIVA